MTGDIRRAQPIVSSLGLACEQTSVKIDAAPKRTTVYAVKLTEQIGKRARRFSYKALQPKGLGATPEALEFYRNETDRPVQYLPKAGLSSRASAAAMRGVAAKISAIVLCL